MSFEAWLFALHLLTAATLVGALVMSWIVLVAQRSVETADATLSLGRVGWVASAAVMAGIAGTIVLGLWLAVSREDVQVRDGWVIAAIVLWFLAAAALERARIEYAKPAAKARALVASGRTGPSPELAGLNRTTTGVLFRALASVAVVLIVVDMIWKPGA